MKTDCYALIKMYPSSDLRFVPKVDTIIRTRALAAALSSPLFLQVLNKMKIYLKSAVT